MPVSTKGHPGGDLDFAKATVSAGWLWIPLDRFVSITRLEPLADDAVHGGTIPLFALDRFFAGAERFAIKPLTARTRIRFRFCISRLPGQDAGRGFAFDLGPVELEADGNLAG